MNATTDVLRASPRIVLASVIFIYLISNNLLVLRFGGYFLIAEGLSFILKKIFGVVLPNNSFIYRPDNAGNCHGCGVFQKMGDGCINVSDHVGMPSGHSLSIAMATTFWILWIWNNTNFDLIDKITRISVLALFAIAVMLSRSSLGDGCHTPLQIIIGGLLGVLTGFASFTLDKKLFK